MVFGSGDIRSEYRREIRENKELMKQQIKAWEEARRIFHGLMGYGHHKVDGHVDKQLEALRKALAESSTV